VVDREKAALLGISETDVANAVLFSLNGNGQTDPKTGEPVLLRNVAALKLNAGPVKTEQKYFQRVIHVTANSVNRVLGSIANDLEGSFANLQLPPGFSIRLAGQIQQQREPSPA
jgi:Cu/Ag efflux pump CusA